MSRRFWEHPVTVTRGRLRRRTRRWARRALGPEINWRVRGRVTSEDNPVDAQTLDDFRFFALLGTWMEEDIVEATVRNAFAQGAEVVYLVDNASTDATVERAVAAGATLVESFETDAYEEQIRMALMNAVVARESLASGADHVWWLWLDADEFPEGPGGMTIAEYLRTLDRRFRFVGSTYYNHLPTEKPEYIPGFHPIDFQPLCERYTSRHVRHCAQPHWKHPLQRFDRDARFIQAVGGFHTGVITTRQRLDLLCGLPARNEHNNALGNRTIQRRYESLDAVYAQNWPAVNNMRGEEPLLGVHPTPWPDPTSTRRWYEPADVEAAKEKWRADV